MKSEILKQKKILGREGARKIQQYIGDTNCLLFFFFFCVCII